MDVGLNRRRDFAMPIYMRITKKGLPVVTGDATAKGHEKWIELLSVQMGPSRSTGPIGGGVTANVSEIAITKSMDSASAALWHESLYGEGLTIQIDFVKSDAPYLTYTLLNAVVSGFQPGPGTSECLTLTFTKMTLDSHGTGPDVSGHAEGVMKQWHVSPGAGCGR
jgi:type VI secretion system secreted protein Hcp